MKKQKPIWQSPDTLKPTPKELRIGTFDWHFWKTESLEVPYAFCQDENIDKLLAAKQSAMDELSSWKNELAA